MCMQAAHFTELPSAIQTVLMTATPEKSLSFWVKTGLSLGENKQVMFLLLPMPHRFTTTV